MHKAVRRYDPCICTNCSGPHPANYRLCPKFPGDHTQKNVKSLAKQNRRKGHPTRKMNNAISFAAIATGNVAERTPSTTINTIQNSPAPKIGAIPDADFLNEIFKFEKKLGKQIVLQTSRKCLPELCTAPTEVDRIFIIYKKLPSLTVFLSPTLIDKFPAPKNLNSLFLGIWNVNGLKTKVSEFKDFIVSNNLDVMLVSETKFQGYPDKVANCVLFNVDRPPSVGGRIGCGTAVYIRNRLNASIMSM